MKKFLIILATASLVISAGCSNGTADDDAGPAPAVPVELFACNYNEGMGPADLDAATAKWNAWADERGVNEYSAWTMTKFYAGPEQTFDVIWLGVATNATAMGRGDDDYLANGGEIGAGFERALTCDTHARFASVEFKAPPNQDNPAPNPVLTFSDCNIAEGKSFDDVAPAITTWASHRTEQGSESGQWVLFPAYGGGGEEFDFKWVTAHPNHESMGADWDSYDVKLAGELFDGLVDCDSSRVYNATNIRRAAGD